MATRREAIVTASFASILAWLGVAGGASAETSPPGGGLGAFLPAYFTPALTFRGGVFKDMDTQQHDGITVVTLLQPGPMSLIVQWRPCNRAEVDAVLGTVRANTNHEYGEKGGDFLTSDDLEITGRLTSGAAIRMAAKTPTGVLMWSIYAPNITVAEARDVFDRVRAPLNRWRSEQALVQTGVTVDVWAEPVMARAKALQVEGRKAEAAAVLREMLTGDATNLTLQLAFAEATPDRAEAQQCLKVVIDRAEPGPLRERALALTGAKADAPSDLPPVKPGARGLQVILVALPPVDLEPVRRAAKACAEALGLPVSVQRLPGAWTPPARPERVWGQRTAERILVSYGASEPSYAGWSVEQWARKLETATASHSPFDRFLAREFIAKMRARPGQYDAARLDDGLAAALDPVKSLDIRTMYVGVTASALYLGDTNYVFNAGPLNRQGGCSILSYDAMLAENVGDPTPSMDRLSQRLAKEMIPAALKQLNLPRPIDPTDPYSSSNGVAATDQKSLTLSAPTRAALDAFRT